MDVLGGERQFIDHLAPVWRAMEDRGRFLVPASLMEHARSRGIDPTPLDFDAARRSSDPPRAKRPQGRKALVASIGDTKVARRLGYGDFARLEHGAGQGYGNDQSGSYAGGPDNADASLVFCPNEYSAALWRRSYPQADVQVIGCPKLDDLPRKDRSDPPTVALTWHWRKHSPPEQGTAFDEHRAAIESLVGRFDLIGHQHPKWATWGIRQSPADLYRKLGIPFVEDFEEVCRRADLLVFDNSSVGFEFAATGRPVVVVNSWMWNRRTRYGGRFWDWATVGLQVDRPDDLGDTIAAALTDPAEVREERERVVSDIYAYGSGAAERAAAALGRWAGEVARAA